MWKETPPYQTGLLGLWVSHCMHITYILSVFLIFSFMKIELIKLKSNKIEYYNRSKKKKKNSRWFNKRSVNKWSMISLTEVQSNHIVIGRLLHYLRSKLILLSYVSMLKSLILSGKHFSNIGCSTETRDLFH